ncbi:HAD-IA family hydrolase [candidate division KSB1 bacterium]|nr:HAD-IA family hydrolase [candidate division KSB1 bacterium]
MKLNGTKGVIFDVHRTLVDDSGFPRERIWKLLRESGADFSMDEYYHLYDELTHQLFQWDKINPFIKIRDIHRRRLCKFYKRFHVTRDVDKDVDYLWHEMGKSRIYPEVPEVLRRIGSTYKMGLLSNADNDDPLIKILGSNGFSFDAIVTSESVRSYKPAPDIFDRILGMMDCDKNTMVMIGDSLLSDVYGARSFGIKVIWINRKHVRRPLGSPSPDYEIDDLKQLYEIL